MITFSYKKSATVQQRSTLVYGSKKATYSLVRAVAFLVFSFLASLHDTDHGYDDTDDRNYNTCNSNYRF